MRSGRRAVMAFEPPKRRVEWKAEDGLWLTQAGWYSYGGNPETEGVWTTQSGAPALQYTLSKAGQRYRFFLPDTLRDPAAITLDLAMSGLNNNAGVPTLSAWLPGEATTACHGISSVQILVSTTNNNNGAPTLVSTGSLANTRLSVRLERRGEAAVTLANGNATYATTAVPNAQRTAFLPDYPLEAPKEACLILTLPPSGATQNVWLFGVVWEEL